MTSTPLIDLHRSAGATFTDLAGFEVPAHFGDADREYGQALAGAVLFDRTPTGKLEVAGKDAPAFLHNLCTNDVNGLPLGGGCEAYFCDHRAKVVAHVLVYHVLSAGRHAFWLEVTPGFNDKLLKHLDKHLISEAVELADQTERFAQFHLAGPRAKAVLEQALGEPVPDVVRVPAHGADVRLDGNVQRPPARPARAAGLRPRLPQRAGRGRLAVAPGRRGDSGRAGGVGNAAGRGRHAGLRHRHQRGPLRHGGRHGPCGRSVTRRAVTWARSRSSWPATGPGSSTGRSSGSRYWRAGSCRPGPSSSGGGRGGRGYLVRFSRRDSTPRWRLATSAAVTRSPGLRLDADTPDGRQPVEVLPFPPVPVRPSL